MIFHWSLNDSKSPQVFRTLLSILTDLNNTVVWMVSARSPISNSSSPLNKYLGIIPSAPLTIGTTVIFMLHSFLVLMQGTSFLFRFLWFSLCGPPGPQSLPYSRFSFFLLIITSVLIGMRLSVSQNPREVCVSHSPRLIFGCACIIRLYGQILISCTIPSESPFQPSCVYSFILLR